MLKSKKYYLADIQSVHQAANWIPGHKTGVRSKLPLAGLIGPAIFYHIDDKILNELTNETAAFLQQEIDMLKQELEEARVDVANYQDEVKWCYEQMCEDGGK